MRYIISKFCGFVKVLGKWLKDNILLILIGFLVFGCGLITGGKFLKRPPIIITGEVVNTDDLKAKMEIAKANTVKITTTTTLNLDNISSSGFLASKRGKYYYPVGCKLIDNLSKANLIYFETEEKAMEAGYIRQVKCD